VARMAEQRLRELHLTLNQAAARLGEVRAELRRETAQSQEYWEGNAADTFRSHVGEQHRVHHLTAARSRLLEAAALAAAAAEEIASRAPGGGTGGTPAGAAATQVGGGHD
jgi:uncharacterized protein YukE